MHKVRSSVYVFDTRTRAADAIRSLSASGFDKKGLSVIGRGYHSEEHPVGFYTSGNRIKQWGGSGGFSGGTRGLLSAPTVFFLPGLGLMAMAGPLVSALVGALEDAVVVDGLTALPAALTEIGVPKDEVIKFETALKGAKYVLMVHGNAEELAKARAVLAGAEAMEAA